MIANIHLLRPWWLLMILPLLGLGLVLWRKKSALHAWSQICDPHLLDHLIQKKGQKQSLGSILNVLLSMFFLILSLTGPSWYKLPVSTYKPIQPRMLVLDMSENMMGTDLTPNRLGRAKFKLQDLFNRKDVGQFGLLAFTEEPFLVSPLTDDGQTISALLSSLSPDIMPVQGHNLEAALEEAGKLIEQAGFSQGQILVLTADSPSNEAITLAKKLSAAHIYSSIMPVKADKKLNPLFQSFANAGQGLLLRYKPDSSDLDSWINAGLNQQLALNKDENIPLWRDEGRWFLIPALLLLLPVFQRGWLQRMAV